MNISVNCLQHLHKIPRDSSVKVVYVPMALMNEVLETQINVFNDKTNFLAHNPAADQLLNHKEVSPESSRNLNPCKVLLVWLHFWFLIWSARCVIYSEQKQFQLPEKKNTVIDQISHYLNKIVDDKSQNQMKKIIWESKLNKFLFRDLKIKTSINWELKIYFAQK